MNIQYLDTNGEILNYITQWDLNRKIKIENIDTSKPIAVHFYNEISSEALVVSPTKGENYILVDVPNILLQESYKLYVSLFVEKDNEHFTEDIFEVPVIKKPKPQDYEYEENIEYINWTKLSEQAKAQLEEMKAVTNEVSRKLENGEFIGPQGPQGEPGKDGANGIDGAKGADGKDGYTPVKGVDYYTDLEKQEIISSTSSALIKDTEKSAVNTYSSNKIEEILTHPSYKTMVVTAMSEGIGFKADYKSSEIKRHADGGGVVILRFNAPDGAGEQSYQYETYKDGLAIFRRAFVDNKNDKVSRIIIKIDDNYNVTKEDEEIIVANKEEIQLLEDNKANYKLKVIRSDKINQLDAREVLTYIDQYDGRLIEFLTNGENPNKAVATGRVYTDTTGNSYLVANNLDGTTTVWNKENYEKHNFECKNLINQTIDLDNLTIDVQGDAPYIASVQKAINKPEQTSDFGVIQVIAYSISKQMQMYTDIETGNIYQRLITGQADKHSFGTWNQLFKIGNV